MSIFSELLCKQFPNVDFPGVDNSSVNKLTLSWKYSSLYNISVRLIYHIYLLPFDNSLNKSSYKNKFHILNDIILDNSQLSLCENEYFFDKFNKSQRAYNAFRRFAHYCKHKYRKKFEIDADLCFNAFRELPSKITISLLENNIIYKFRISDLLNIINKSLSNSPEFFAEPMEIKNPYTNLPFTLCNLYNIYFKLREINYLIPILFHQYFACNFDLIKFKNLNESIIRDKAINNFIRDGTIDEQYHHILRMFYQHHRSVYFKIDPYFPRSKIVTVFKPYLRLFLLEEYSLNPYVRETNKVQLEYNLTLFSQLNPEFGKKIWIRKRSSSTRSGYIFNENVISSYESELLHRPTPRSLTPFEYPTNEEEREADGIEANEEEREADGIEADGTNDNDEERNRLISDYEISSTLSEILLRYRPSYIVQNNQLLADYFENAESEYSGIDNPDSIDNSFNLTS